MMQVHGSSIYSSQKTLVLTLVMIKALGAKKWSQNVPIKVSIKRWAKLTKLVSVSPLHH